MKKLLTAIMFSTCIATSAQAGITDKGYAYLLLMTDKCNMNLDKEGLVAMAKMSSGYADNNEASTAWLKATVEGLQHTDTANNCSSAHQLFKDDVPPMMQELLQK